VGARDGREAYQALQDDANFTAAVFDVVMPHISGPELVRYMRTEKRFNKIPVMMMTAEQDPKLSSDSFAAGALVFLPKPFTTTQLQTMLRMLGAKQSARVNNFECGNLLRRRIPRLAAGRSVTRITRRQVAALPKR